MSYNTPETVYHKAAKRLLHAGRQILASGRLRTLAEHHMPMINELTPDLLGFDIKTELPAFIEAEDEKDILRVIAEIRGSIRLPQGRFAAIPDNLTAEEIASQTANAAKRAADRLGRRRPGSNMGYLRQKADGTTSLSIITPSSVSSLDENGEKTVTLGQLIGKVKNGASAIQGFKEDRRNSVKAFNPIYYGAFSSYGPAYDSTFANLTKQETELVYNTYGDDVGVAYAESIKNFSKNCEYASLIVDNLLDILSGNEHKNTSKYIEEQKLLRSEESLVKSVFTSSDKTNNSNSNQNNTSNSSDPAPVDFESLRSLAKDGIDMSFLEGLQTQYTKLPATRLDKNAVLLESLRDVQHQRLSGPPPQHLGQVIEVVYCRLTYRLYLSVTFSI
jgi:bromodomain-containing protein 7/9